MGKRILCLLCAAVILWAMAMGIDAREWEEAPLNAQPDAERLAAGSAVRSSTPLVSAMMLILAGLGVSMLFDKRDKR